jgi:hydrogenase nickel incorporation protein HypA/HybF
VQIVPDIFEFSFREAVRDTGAVDAELNIEVLEIRMRCDECAMEFSVMNNSFSCPACKSAELSIIQGNELYIKSIEGE